MSTVRNPWVWVPTLYFAEGIPYVVVNNISVIMLKSTRLRSLICGRPIVVINDGVIVQSELRRLRMTTEDLCEELRQKEAVETTISPRARTSHTAETVTRLTCEKCAKTFVATSRPEQTAERVSESIAMRR